MLSPYDKLYHFRASSQPVWGSLVGFLFLAIPALAGDLPELAYEKYTLSNGDVRMGEPGKGGGGRASPTCSST